MYFEIFPCESCTVSDIRFANFLCIFLENISSRPSTSSLQLSAQPGLGSGVVSNSSEAKVVPQSKTVLASKKPQSSIDSFLVKTTSTQKKNLDEQVARFIYATNSAFRLVEHPQFIKLMQDLRPAYSPPNRKEISGPLLDCIFLEEKSKLGRIVENETVCLGLDGWSNVHNEPIVCMTITTKNGDVYLVDTIDTSGNSHTADYLAAVTTDRIKKCQQEINCKIRSVVTDNAANVSKMRRILENDNDLDIISYGCSAHILNLLSNDFQMSDIKKHVVNVVKYFRNNHFANASLRQSGATKLVMPCEVRWSSMADCMQSYIENWPIMLKICEENRDVIDKTVQQEVSNLLLKRNVEEMLMLLKPISDALDKVQKSNCTLSESVLAWKELLEKVTDQTYKKKIIKRYHMAMTPPHFLAYMLDPKERASGMELTTEEKKIALDFAKERYSDACLLLIIVKFQSRSSPFQEALFTPQLTNEVAAYDWWKSQKTEIEKISSNAFPAIEQLLTAKASSASVERIFSSFGLVHSKLRNRLGTEKASKLVFLFKVFNSSH